MSAVQYAYDEGLEVVNYSYGYYPPSDNPAQPYSLVDGSSELSRTFDAYADMGLLAIISAGNDGPNYATLGMPGDAFNVLTVGNMDDLGSVDRIDDTLATSSSRGNTYDGRVKPEVAAPGSAIASCGLEDDDFIKMWGTSMAAPHVAGVAALLTDYWAKKYKQRLTGKTGGYSLLRGGPLAVRAMIMSMADEKTGELGGSLKDRQTGAGYINAYDSMLQVNRTRLYMGDATHKQELWYSVSIPAGKTFKAALVWNRIVNVTSKDAIQPIADLDLHLHASSGMIASSNSDQTNWEKVSWTNTSAATKYCLLRVSAFFVPEALNRAQTFALSCNFAITPVMTPRGNFADFDEDARMDYMVWRPDSGKWYGKDIQGKTANGIQWGMIGDVPVPGEWHANSWYASCDPAVWRPLDGKWYARTTGSSSTILNEAWGTAGDIPVPGNYNGSGGTDLAVWRPSNGEWYVRYKPEGVEVTTQWGLWDDIPVPADYGGSYYNTDLGVWRPSTGSWYVWELISNKQIVDQQWGMFGDIPVPADFDGDGNSELCVFRPSNSTWYLRNLSGTYTRSIRHGSSGDIPSPMDVNGDGKAELCFFRPLNGWWYCREVDGSTHWSFDWGRYTDIPVGTHN